MKTQIVSFENRDDIRIEFIENMPFFCAKDVCKILGHSNSSQAVRDNCKEKGISHAYTLTDGGKQKTVFISESNLYRLIMRSKLESAVKFQDWIVEEVLPTIRRTGSFIDGNNVINQVFK